ncbi:MAG: GIY-YIG nuclease family protein [Candidatus Omnitrophota bacterium]
MWYVYILQCSDNTLYAGITNDLAVRLDKHNKGKASKYTRGRTPVKMVFRERYTDRNSALKRECQIKKLTRREKLSLIAADRKILNTPFSFS